MPNPTQSPHRPSGRTLRSEADIYLWIIVETRKVAGCRDLDLRFALTRHQAPVNGGATWDVRGVNGWADWSGVCREAFLDAVKRAQALFDLA